MAEDGKKNNFKLNSRTVFGLHCILSAFMAMFVFMLIMARNRVTPFGDNTYLVYDCKRQYLDLYAYLKSIVSGSNDLFYTFSGMGLDMTGITAYNLMSPFLICFVLVPVRYYPMTFTLVFMLKIGCMAAAMDVFLAYTVKDILGEKGISGRKMIIPDVFAVTYALSTYVLTYGTNFMWLDSLIMFPLVMLTLKRLIREKRVTGYIICIALTMLVNYYLGYMIMLFTGIWTVTELVLMCIPALGKADCGKPKTVFLRYILASMAGIGADAFLLLPTFISLSGTLRDSDVGVHKIGTNIFPSDVCLRNLSCSFDLSQIYTGLPNITCTIAAVILCILMFTVKGPSLRQRFQMGVMLFIMVISVCFDKVNLVWHAFSEPSGYLYRESFIIVFLIITCACTAAVTLTVEVQNKRSMAVSGVCIFLFAAFEVYSAVQSDATFLTREVILQNIVFGAAVIAVVIIVIVATARSNSLLLLMSAGMLLIINLEDVCINGNTAYEAVCESEETVSGFNEKYDHILNAVNSVKLNDDSFFRMENRAKRQQNDSMLFDYNGIELYCSSNKAATMDFLTKLGYTDCEFFVDYGLGSTQTADSLLGIKYILDDSSDTPRSLYTDTDTSRADSEKVYLNPCALTVAMCVCDDCLPEEADYSDPFTMQEDIYNSLTGSDSDIFTDASYTYVYDRENDRAEFTVTAVTEGEMYMYIGGSLEQPLDLQIECGDVYISSYGNAACHSTVSLGYVDEGEQIEVYISSNTDLSPEVTPMFVTENSDALVKAFAGSTERMTGVTEVSSSHLLIEADKTEDVTGILTTIPENKDFKVYINKKQVTTEKKYGALMYIPLSESENGQLLVELRYFPRGFTVGIVISALSAAVTLYVLKRYYHNKKNMLL